MDEPTMETLARRLDRVERENRRLKQAGVVALGVIAAVLLMGQATQGKVAKVIEAEKFVLRDPVGNVAARLELFADSAHLTFVDKKKRVLSSFRNDGFHIVDPDREILTAMGPGLLTLNSIGVGGLTISSDPDFGLSMVLHDKKTSRATLGLTPEGLPTLTLYDKDGTIRAELGSISLVTTRTGGVEQRPESSLVLFDKAGKVIWSAP